MLLRHSQGLLLNFNDHLILAFAKVKGKSNTYLKGCEEPDLLGKAPENCTHDKLMFYSNAVHEAEQ